MDQERLRIQEDLRGLLAGDVRCDDLFLQLYASDASIYEIKPLAAVCPRHAEDVITCVQYASENGIPVRPRGAGTGLAGESLGRGLVLDFSRYMHRIGEIGDGAIRVQPGVVHARLNEYLAPQGFTYGPDPATTAVTTMGSVLAIDASGSHWLKYGSARRHVRTLEVVLADGTLVKLGREPIEDHADRPPRLQELVAQVAALLRRDAALIDKYQPRESVNRCGYGLQNVLADDHVDMARLLVGSEGTLAVITEATVDIQTLPAHRGVALLLFDRLESAVRAVMDLLPQKPNALDVMDRRHVSLAREKDLRYDLLIPAETEAVLLLEHDGDTPQEVRDKLQASIGRLRRRRHFLSGSRLALDNHDIDFYWQLARKVVPTLYRLRGTSRPLPIVEDIAVPPEKLADFLPKLFNVMKRHETTVSFFAHAGHGQMHVRPFLDLSDPEDVNRMHQLAQDLYDEVLAIGGTISGEHGDGLSRTEFVKKQYGPLYETFRELKAIFDPAGVLNPGKKVSDGSSSSSLTNNLRPVGVPVPQTEEQDNGGVGGGTRPFPLQLHWDQEDIAHGVHSCNGCGLCRSQLSDVRMCPIFRLAPREEASPRAKANLLRGILTGRLDAETVATEEFKDIVDLCVNCHQCRMECPASVDIPKLMIEAKAAYVAINGLRPIDVVMTRMDSIAAVASRLSRLTNWSLGNRTMRWLMEKTLGVAQGRKLPTVAAHSFLRQAARRRLTRVDRGTGLRVLYFVDTYANYFDTRLADAFVSVMQHNGVSVYVHPGQLQSAMPLISYGAIGKARRIAARNLELLADAVRQGYQIVTTEPAAASCLVHEYTNLFEDDDVHLVAENTMEACTYLWKLHQTGKLKLDLQPLNYAVAYHEPCHLRSLQVGSPGESLLRLIPGLSVTRIDKGCSGMAGTYGLKRENYRSSLRAGFDLITGMRLPQFQAGATECSTCKIQMEQGTTKPTVHPVKILAQAYGLTAESNPLAVRSGDLIVSNP